MLRLIAFVAPLFTASQAMAGDAYSHAQLLNCNVVERCDAQNRCSAVLLKRAVLLTKLINSTDTNAWSVIWLQVSEDHHDFLPADMFEVDVFPLEQWEKGYRTSIFGDGDTAIHISEDGEYLGKESTFTYTVYKKDKEKGLIARDTLVCAVPQ
ncbi:hypothetical protein [Ruegeria sp. Ofav3-42]|uniref:hypothetical protein n=1 Tax=Ruegeria sp. Ofav3-42 TaxID=2917759 RepID=UPI001EF59D06|nr:hypothetical protein [Ruegeria sp. Ofav3-42]MCG7518276.1 hypothetical protein [Ruegeria sp. Ofav3-42]